MTSLYDFSVLNQDNQKPHPMEISNIPSRNHHLKLGLLL